MGEEYCCLECVMERFKHCDEFYYNKRILRDEQTGKYIFVIDNSMPVFSGELILEEVAKR